MNAIDTLHKFVAKDLTDKMGKPVVKAIAAAMKDYNQRNCRLIRAEQQRYNALLHATDLLDMYAAPSLSPDKYVQLRQIINELKGTYNPNK